MGTSKLSGKPDEIAGGVTCDGLASHPGGVAIFLVASCYGNRDKLRQSWATRLVRLNLTYLPISFYGTKTSYTSRFP